MQVTYGFLREAMRKGLRNGNGGVWVGLSVHFTRHRCVMRGFINANIVEKLLAIVEMIYETPASRIFKRGFEKALEILSAGMKNPLRKWLKDPEFIFWLGACSR